MQEIPKQDLTRAGQPDESLGERLSRVRESQHLTVREAAMRLAIDASVIEALEAERFQELGAPIYVRGYLVRYARLLGLPEQPLVEAYRNRMPAEPPPLKPTSSIPASNGGRRWGARWLAYLLLLAGVVWLGWLGLQEVSLRQEDDFAGQEIEEGGGLALPRPGPAPPPTAQTRSPAPASPAPASPAPAIEPQSPAPGAGTTEPSAQPPAPAQPAPEPEATVAAEPVVETLEAAPEADFPVEPVPAQTPESLPVEAPAEVTPDQPPADQTPALPPGQARLVMSFNADCWVDVKDANDNRLVYGIMKANTVQTLTGAAPFSLVLGNAQAVSLTINGQTVAPDRYVPSRGTVARVVLEAPAG